MEKEVVYSVVVPVLNEQEVLQEFYRRLVSVLEESGEEFEVIFVNDGSTDKSLEVLRKFCVEDCRVKVIDFSRNFGHQVAITSGMDYASGRAVVVIDADLQDPPEVILEFIGKWLEGFDVVYGVRKERPGESFFKKFSASVFYRVLRALTDVDVPVDAGDFRLLDRKVVDSFKLIRERNRYIRGLTSWVGFRQAGVLYDRERRFAGETKYSLQRMFKLAVDGVVSFTNLPLKLASYSGFFVAGLSFLYLIYALVLGVVLDEAVPGWTSMVIAVLFIGGVQLIFLGVLGEYVGRINDEVKNRPLYLVKDVINFGEIKNMK